MYKQVGGPGLRVTKKFFEDRPRATRLLFGLWEDFDKGKGLHFLRIGPLDIEVMILPQWGEWSWTITVDAMTTGEKPSASIHVVRLDDAKAQAEKALLDAVYKKLEAA